MSAKNTSIEMEASETAEPGETSALAKEGSTGVTVVPVDEGRRIWKEHQNKWAEEERLEEAKTKRINENLDKIIKSLPYKIIWYTAVAFLYSLSIAAIVIGSIYHNREDCPAEPIALTMIITGVVVVIIDINQVFIPIVRKLILKQDTPPNNEQEESNPQQQQEPTWKKCLFFILAVLKFVFCIYAYVIVYGLYSSVEYIDKDHAYYCNRTLYLGSFWILTLPFIFIGYFIFVVLFAYCLACCLS